MRLTDEQIARYISYGFDTIPEMVAFAFGIPLTNKRTKEWDYETYHEFYRTERDTYKKLRKMQKWGEAEQTGRKVIGNTTAVTWRVRV